MMRLAAFCLLAVLCVGEEKDAKFENEYSQMQKFASQIGESTPKKHQPTQSPTSQPENSDPVTSLLLPGSNSAESHSSISTTKIPMEIL